MSRLASTGRPSRRHAGIDYRVVIPRLEAGERVTDLAREYGVVQSAISKTARAKGWKGRQSSNRGKS